MLDYGLYEHFCETASGIRASINMSATIAGMAESSRAINVQSVRAAAIDIAQGGRPSVNDYVQAALLVGKDELKAAAKESHKRREGRAKTMQRLSAEADRIKDELVELGAKLLPGGSNDTQVVAEQFKRKQEELSKKEEELAAISRRGMIAKGKAPAIDAVTESEDEEEEEQEEEAECSTRKRVKFA